MTTLITIPFENDQAEQARALLGAASEAGYDPTDVRTGRQGFRVPEEVYEEYVTTLAGGPGEVDSTDGDSTDGDSTDGDETDGDETDGDEADEAKVEETKVEETKAPAKKTPAKKTAAKKTTTSKSSLDDVLS